MNAAIWAFLGILATAGIGIGGTYLTVRTARHTGDREANNDATKIVVDATVLARKIETEAVKFLGEEVIRLGKQVQDMRRELSSTSDRATRLEQELRQGTANLERSERNVATLRRRLIEAGIEVPELERLEPTHSDSADF